MKLVSSAEDEHPSVAKLYEIYHSKTHLLFRMEYCGPEYLYRRLSYRQKTGEKCCPLSIQQTRSLMNQAICAVWHLHTRSHICHRDIKSENFIVNETPGEI